MSRVAAVLGAVAMWPCMCGAATSAVGSEAAWMTEQTLRAAFIGKTLDGYYADGEDWTETYRQDGRLDYSDRKRRGAGYWYFRDHVFCTFYDPGHDINGGCFTAFQVSANCYEFYLAGVSEREADPAGGWVARASRRDEPSTCEARPTV
jgi:hypothetical protein